MIDYLLEQGIKSVLFWALGLAALFVACVTFIPAFSNAFPPVPGDKWQAVFLNNRQVYFGKLKNENATYVTLSDVYYLQTATDLDQSQNTSASLNLVKLGGEVHGPEDTIYIPKSSVLFWENMKDTSRVVKTIMSTKQ